MEKTRNLKEEEEEKMDQFSQETAVTYLHEEGTRKKGEEQPIHKSKIK